MGSGGTLDIAAVYADIRARGYGLTVNAWAADEDPDVAVMLWRDGRPMASCAGRTITEALERVMVLMRGMPDG